MRNHTFSKLAVVAATLCIAAPGCFAHDWIDELPPAAQKAVAKVISQQKKPTADEKEAIRREAEVKDDIELGKKYAAEVLKELKLSDDKVGQDRISRIGAEISEIANQTLAKVTWGDKRLSVFPYSFTLVKGDEVNAFSLPGGPIFIYDGLIKYTESDDELAGVIAHEISHAAFRHVATLRREQSKLEALTLPLILIAILSGGQDGANVAQGGMLLNQAIGSGWSVKAETAADYGGLQFMVKSKYNPTGQLSFMERLAYDDRHRPDIDWGIYRTHPPSRERAKAMISHFNDLKLPIQRSLVTKTFACQYAKTDHQTTSITFAGIKLMEVAGADQETRSRVIGSRLNEFFDSVPKLHEVRVINSSILGSNKKLFEVTAYEADAQKIGLSETTKLVYEKIRSAVYDLNYRVWDAY